MKKKYTFQDVLLRVILLVLVLVILYSGLRILEPSVLSMPETEQKPVPSKTITRGGVDYFPKQDITVVMVLGIDQFGPVQSSNYHRNEGAADSVMLLIFDEKQETASVLYLNRDTMLDMDVLGLGGKYAGTAYGQLALAHTYGSGLEDSCENVKNTLMRFIHGLTIDYYVAMNMDALPILNDAVGGVTVEVKDDFSKINPSITVGRLTLRGDQVIDYLRTRRDVGDQKNVSRMERQREYVDAFLQQFYAKESQDLDFVIRLYEELAPYIVTDCSVDTMSNMLSRYADFPVVEVISPEGENIVAEGHYQFHVDEALLDELILRLFYAPKYAK